MLSFKVNREGLRIESVSVAAFAGDFHWREKLELDLFGSMSITGHAHAAPVIKTEMFRLKAPGKGRWNRGIKAAQRSEEIDIRRDVGAAGLSKRVLGEDDEFIERRIF